MVMGTKGPHTMSAPEDNPADDVQPTKEEWEEFVGDESPKTEPDWLVRLLELQKAKEGYLDAYTVSKGQDPVGDLSAKTRDLWRRYQDNYYALIGDALRAAPRLLAIASRERRWREVGKDALARYTEGALTPLTAEAAKIIDRLAELVKEGGE